MTSRHARLKRLERAFAPHVLAGYRFATHVTVGRSDPRNGTSEHVPLGGPIAELLVYAATRDEYRATVAALRPHFLLLEG